MATMISPSFEAEPGKPISSEEMDSIERVFVDMIKLQSSQRVRNMIVLKASAFGEYDTLLALNNNQNAILSFVESDMTLNEFKSKLDKNGIQYTEEELNAFLTNILQLKDSQVIPHLYWYHYMHAFFLEDAKNQDPIVRQFQTLSNTQKGFARSYYDRIMRITQEIENHALLGVIDAEQSTIQSGIASLN